MWFYGKLKGAIGLILAAFFLLGPFSMKVSGGESPGGNTFRITNEYGIGRMYPLEKKCSCCDKALVFDAPLGLTDTSYSVCNSEYKPFSGNFILELDKFGDRDTVEISLKGCDINSGQQKEYVWIFEVNNGN